MTLREIVDALGLEILAGGDRLDRTVAGVYCGDLLSNALAASHPGDLWITIQHHVNVIGVARIAELSGILLAANVEPAEPVITRADEMGIPLLRASVPTFECAARLHRVLSREPR
jgi:predicted transcriptional regulator